MPVTTLETMTFDDGSDDGTFTGEEEEVLFADGTFTGEEEEVLFADGTFTGEAGGLFDDGSDWPFCELSEGIVL